jgi:hypothetical protein
MLEFTSAGIPISLRPFFQEYELEKLDPEKSAFTVIERTLAWGDIEELRWLFSRYGNARIEQWIREAGWRCLPKRRFKFWITLFRIVDYRRGERIWAN